MKAISSGNIDLTAYTSPATTTVQGASWIRTDANSVSNQYLYIGWYGQADAALLQVASSRYVTNYPVDDNTSWEVLMRPGTTRGYRWRMISSGDALGTRNDRITGFTEDR